jgi:hypothetical protein
VAGKGRGETVDLQAGLRGCWPYFKGLRDSWQRIQPQYLREYKELDLDTKDLEAMKAVSRRISEGPTTQVSTAGSQEPTTHSSVISLKELAPEQPNSLSRRRRSRKRSRTGKRYDKVGHKVEQDQQDVPDAQSDRRGPPGQTTSLERCAHGELV